MVTNPVAHNPSAAESSRSPARHATPSLPYLTEAAQIKHCMLVFPTKGLPCRNHLQFLKLHDQESYQKEAGTFLDRLLS